MDTCRGGERLRLEMELETAGHVMKGLSVRGSAFIVRAMKSFYQSKHPVETCL